MKLQLCRSAVFIETYRLGLAQKLRYPGLAHGKDSILQRYGKAGSFCASSRHNDAGSSEDLWKVIYVVRNPKDGPADTRERAATMQGVDLASVR